MFLSQTNLITKTISIMKTLFNICTICIFLRACLLHKVQTGSAALKKQMESPEQVKLTILNMMLIDVNTLGIKNNNHGRLGGVLTNWVGTLTNAQCQRAGNRFQILSALVMGWILLYAHAIGANDYSRNWYSLDRLCRRFRHENILVSSGPGYSHSLHQRSMKYSLRLSYGHRLEPLHGWNQ